MVKKKHYKKQALMCRLLLVNINEMGDKHVILRELWHDSALTLAEMWLYRQIGH